MRLHWLLRTVAATLPLVVVAVALRIGLPVYRPQAAFREIERVGGWVGTVPGGPVWLRKWIGNDAMKVFDKVRSVHLESTLADDATMEQVGWLSELEWLGLDNTPVTDRGLAHFHGLTELEGLDLNDTHVTDAGLRHLEGMHKLEGLFLMNTPVSDAGLAHLKGLTRLKWLWLGNTKVTEAEVVELRLKLPAAEIDWW
jgi:hypothetical protein